VISNIADIVFQHTVTNRLAETLDFYRTFVIANVLNGVCDFITQSILIYRCWILWKGNIRVVIVPSFFAVSFLGLWMASIGSTTLSDNEFSTATWVNAVTWSSLVMSICVNAIVTGMIVFKIVGVYQDAKPLYNDPFAASGGSKLRSIIFIVVESALTLLCVQVINLVLNILPSLPALHGYQVISFIYQMLNGITPTLIQVRVALGLSFDSQESLPGVSSDLRFGSAQATVDSVMADEYDIDPNQENRDVDIEHQENKDSGKASEERKNDVLEIH